METLRSLSTTVHEFWRSVVEWRSPASAPYLMLVNIAFWSAALCCSELVQLRILLSLAACVFSWDILLSPTHERSIAVHIALWPVQSIWRTLSVCGCLYSSHQLKLQQLEHACIAAYATVGCLLVNPVWEYYEVNQKIIVGARLCGRKMASATKVVVLRPLQILYQAVKYVVLLQFIPPLWRALKSTVCRIGTAIKFGFCYVVNGIKNLIVGTINYFGNMVCRLKNLMILYIIEPIMNFCFAVGRFLRYWLCAYWWPDLKQWIKTRIGAPLQRAFNYVCYCLVYVVCGRWIPALKAWIVICLRRLKNFTVAQLHRFGAFLYRTIVVPTKRFLWKKFEELRIWLRQCLHRLAVAIRDSVLWPFCLLVADAGRELCLLMYRFLLQPMLDYTYQRYKVLETAILIYFLGPVCDTIVKNIPEKSPFCDDSDVELEGMLPDEITEEMEEVTAAAAAGTDAEDSLGSIEPPSPLDEEEQDFQSGLAFPTIHASESSDEEFDLRKPTKRAAAKRKRQKERQPNDVGVAPEVPISELAPVPIPTRRRNGPHQSFDDEFEVLRLHKQEI